MRIQAWVGLMFLSLLLGCGSGTTAAHISGNVTVDGALVEQGQIFFEPLDDNPTVGAGIITDGIYEVVCAPGRYKVIITGSRAIPGAPLIRISAEEEIEPRESMVPSKYNKKTTLEKEVNLGEQTIDFELTS